MSQFKFSGYSNELPTGQPPEHEVGLQPEKITQSEPVSQPEAMPPVDTADQPLPQPTANELHSDADDGFDFSRLCAEGIERDYEQPTPKPVRHRPNSPAKIGKGRRKLISLLIRVLIILVAAILLAMVVISSMRDYLGLGKNKVITITVSQGMTTTQIAELLDENGAINSKLFFKIFSKLKGYDGTYRAGVYQFNAEIGYDGIVAELQKGNTYSTATVKIPESATVDEIIDLLVKAGVCTRQEFLNAMQDDYQYSFIKYIPEETVRYRFEGYLYPDTYEFFKSDAKNSAHLAIDKMLSNFNSKLPKDYEDMVEKLGERYPDIETTSGKLTLHDALTIASIVSLEANGFPEEAGKVSAVFYNRLVWDEPRYLGSTPTYKYPDNRYNTNAPDGNDNTKDGFEGLPPGPQCSPTADSILGALQPEDFKATYFVTDSSMKFYYNTSYKEHLNTINKLKSQGKWDA